MILIFLSVSHDNMFKSLKQKVNVKMSWKKDMIDQNEKSSY